MHASWAARTDPGLRRSRNEDCYCARPELGLFVVADGMGGHAGGEIAARIAVDAIAGAVESTRSLGPDDPWPVPFDASLGRGGNRLRAGFDQARRCVAERAAAVAELRGMATTAVAVLLDERAGMVAHVGDSRAYLSRPGGLVRLTSDHSWVEERVRAGLLTEAAARAHPWRNIVTRAISGEEAAEAEVSELALRAGDRLLLCTDGLSSVLPDPEIGDVVARPADRQAACDELVRRVNARGGPDNVTTLVLDIGAG